MNHKDPRIFSPHILTTHLATLLLGAIIGALIILHTVVGPREAIYDAQYATELAADIREGNQL